MSPFDTLAALLELPADLVSPPCRISMIASASTFLPLIDREQLSDETS